MAREKSLKEENEPKLFAYSAFQIFLFVTLAIFLSGETDDFLTDISGMKEIVGVLTSAGALTVGTIVTTMFIDLLPHEVKERIALLSGKFPHPHAFSKIAVKMDLPSAIKQGIERTFQDAQSSETQLWGKLLRETIDYPGVAQSYKKFLLLRELAVLHAILTASLAIAYWLLLPPPYGLVFTIVSIVIYMILAVSARASHVALIRNVIGEGVRSNKLVAV